jgi:hypothetical protein
MLATLLLNWAVKWPVVLLSVILFSIKLSGDKNEIDFFGIAYDFILIQLCAGGR